MKNQKIAAAASLLLPMIASAHPGHFDGAPIAHSAAHGLPYVLAFAALCIAAKGTIEKALRAFRARARHRQ